MASAQTAYSQNRCHKYCLKGENWELGEGAGEGRAEDEGEETMREWDGRDGETTRG